MLSFTILDTLNAFLIGENSLIVFGSVTLTGLTFIVKLEKRLLGTVLFSSQKNAICSLKKHSCWPTLEK